MIFCSATARPGLACIQESEYTEYWCHCMCKRQRGYNVILGPALHSSIAAARCDTLQPSQIGLTRDKEHTVLLCKKKGSHSHLRLPIQKQFSLHSCFYSKRLYTLNGLLCADVPLRNYSLTFDDVSATNCRECRQQVPFRKTCSLLHIWHIYFRVVVVSQCEE